MKLFGCFGPSPVLASPPVLDELVRNEQRLNSQAMREDMKARADEARAKQAQGRLDAAAVRNDMESMKHEATLVANYQKSAQASKAAATGLRVSVVGVRTLASQTEHMTVLKETNGVTDRVKNQGVFDPDIIAKNRQFIQEADMNALTLQSVFNEDSANDVDDLIRKAMSKRDLALVEQERLERQQLEEMRSVPTANPTGCASAAA